jgi:hypothetical protein
MRRKWTSATAPYGPVNMQCAGRAIAHKEPLVDGKSRRPVNVCFREAAARHAMAGQSPERAEVCVTQEAGFAKSSSLLSHPPKYRNQDPDHRVYLITCQGNVSLFR